MSRAGPGKSPTSRALAAALDLALPTLGQLALAETAGRGLTRRAIREAVAGLEGAAAALRALEAAAPAPAAPEEPTC